MWSEFGQRAICGCRRTNTVNPLALEVPQRILSINTKTWFTFRVIKLGLSFMLIMLNIRITISRTAFSDSFFESRSPLLWPLLIVFHIVVVLRYLPLSLSSIMC